MEELKKIGQRIKSQRKIMNLKQNDFEINRQQFSAYENGKQSMNILLFRDICKKLKVSSDYLLDLPNEFDNLSDEKKVNYLMMKKLSRYNDLKLTGMIIDML